MRCLDQGEWEIQGKKQVGSEREPMEGPIRKKRREKEGWRKGEEFQRGVSSSERGGEGSLEPASAKKVGPQKKRRQNRAWGRMFRRSKSREASIGAKENRRGVQRLARRRKFTRHARNKRHFLGQQGRETGETVDQRFRKWEVNAPILSMVQAGGCRSGDTSKHRRVTETRKERSQPSL